MISNSSSGALFSKMPVTAGSAIDKRSNHSQLLFGSSLPKYVSGQGNDKFNTPIYPQDSKVKLWAASGVAAILSLGGLIAVLNHGDNQDEAAIASQCSTETINPAKTSIVKLHNAFVQRINDSKDLPTYNPLNDEQINILQSHLETLCLSSLKSEHPTPLEDMALMTLINFYEILNPSSPSNIMLETLNEIDTNTNEQAFEKVKEKITAMDGTLEEKAVEAILGSSYLEQYQANPNAPEFNFIISEVQNIYNELSSNPVNILAMTDEKATVTITPPVTETPAPPVTAAEATPVTETPAPSITAEETPITETPAPPITVTEATPVTEAPISSEPRLHTVQEGESFSLIAIQYGMTLDEIIELNRYRYINENGDLFAGAVIYIPNFGRYQVKSGDTLSQLATTHGTSSKAIIEASLNHVAAGDKVAVR